MQTLIKEITEICAKGNPEIMELKFGCKVLFNGEKWNVAKIGVGQNSVLVAHTDGVQVTRLNITTLERNNAILGRDITLEDVLMAIEEKYQRRLSNCMVFNEKKEYDANQGDEYCQSCKITTLEILTMWDLSKPLHLQDLPTLQFIRNLLTK